MIEMYSEVNVTNIMLGIIRPYRKKNCLTTVVIPNLGRDTH